MTSTASVSPDEREAGLAVVRRWPEAHIRECAQLTVGEQALIVLAAGLLDLAPGSPTDRDPIEVP